MQITEPVTMLTDYGLGLLALFWATRLFVLNRCDRHWSRSLWAIGFVATAAASLLGGSFHGLRTHLTESVAAMLWKGSVYSIGVASWSMFSAVIVATSQRPWRQWLLVAVAVKFLLFATWMTTHSEFRFVIFDYGSAMIAILIAQVHGWLGRRDQSAAWITTGVIVGFFAALIQLSGFAIHRQFNHNDLFHVIQAVSFYLFYRGGRRLTDRADLKGTESVSTFQRGESGKPR